MAEDYDELNNDDLLYEAHMHRLKSKSDKVLTYVFGALAVSGAVESAIYFSQSDNNGGLSFWVGIGIASGALLSSYAAVQCHKDVEIDSDKSYEYALKQFTKNDV